MNTCIVGKGLPRVDAVPKVTGEAQYTVDLKMPGMLVGKILRSPHAHARITSIDTSAAQALQGVLAVITAKDVPDGLFSFYQWLADKNILCREKVRDIGDEVAAVAAVDEDTAEEALSLIEVEYEPLPAVFDLDAAMAPGAPLVHDDKESNATWNVERLFGDPDKALAECDFVVEGTYVTHAQAHTCLETSNCVAKWDKKDRLTVWTNAQVSPHSAPGDRAHSWDQQAQRARHQLVHGRRLRVQARHGHEGPDRRGALAAHRTTRAHREHAQRGVHDRQDPLPVHDASEDRSHEGRAGSSSATSR